MRVESDRVETKFDKVQQAEPTEVVSNLDGSLYAVLFNANEGPHSHDLRFVYHSLIDAGVSDADISVLEGDGRTQNRFVDKPATARNLDSVVDSIRQKASPNDRLLVYITNHGNLVNGQCNVEAYYETIWEKDFEQMMQDLPTNFGLFYFAQCHSGGFAERMGYGRNIGMSNADREGESFGRDYQNVGAYFTHFLFPNILVPGKTIETAFDEAVFENTSTKRLLHEEGRKEGLLYPIGGKAIEIPQLRWQNADPSKLYLGSTSPSKK